MLPDDGRTDEYFAINLRAAREHATLSQAELAQKMADAGYAWTQATVWKLEQGRREPRLAEAVALGTALGLWHWTELTAKPDDFEISIKVDRWRAAVNTAAKRTRQAASDQLEAIVNLTFAVREAQDAGYPQPWLEIRSGGWLSMTPEATILREVLTARVADDFADSQSMERLTEEEELETKILAALDASGVSLFVEPHEIQFIDASPNEPA
jgi:transcriptional regulator with XRE-family HTH domain